jgi:tyrosyl-tRNA synthetase
VVALYHGQNEALRVRDSFNKTFKDKQLDPNLKQQIMFNSATVSLLEATQKATALSSSQINRLVSQGGIRINNEVISDSKLTLDLTRPVLLQIGRHRFFELYFK